MATIILQPIGTHHIPKVIEIINDVIANTVSHYDYELRTVSTQETIIENSKKNNFPFVVALIDNVVVGFGQYGAFRDKEGNKFTVEHSVYVDKKHQNKGIGKMLLLHLIEIAKSQNVHTMVAVIDSTNQNSIIFHERFGFKVMGILKEVAYKHNTWLDSVIMQLMIE
jgi:L-amino acid N-acyltransferase YncA